MKVRLNAKTRICIAMSIAGLVAYVAGPQKLDTQASLKEKSTRQRIITLTRYAIPASAQRFVAFDDVSEFNGRFTVYLSELTELDPKYKTELADYFSKNTRLEPGQSVAVEFIPGIGLRAQTWMSSLLASVPQMPELQMPDFQMPKMQLPALQLSDLEPSAKNMKLALSAVSAALAAFLMWKSRRKVRSLSRNLTAGTRTGVRYSASVMKRALAMAFTPLSKLTTRYALLERRIDSLKVRMRNRKFSEQAEIAQIETDKKTLEQELNGLNFLWSDTVEQLQRVMSANDNLMKENVELKSRIEQNASQKEPQFPLEDLRASSMAARFPFDRFVTQPVPLEIETSDEAVEKDAPDPLFNESGPSH